MKWNNPILKIVPIYLKNGLIVNFGHISQEAILTTISTIFIKREAILSIKMKRSRL